MIQIPQNIKNILFDFGGVIINLNLNASIAAFEALRGPNATISFNQWTKYGVEPAFEKGELSSKQFCDRMRELLDNPVPDEAIHKAWNAMILDIPAQRIRKIEELKQSYRVFLLSNTSEIHYNLYTNRFVKDYEYKSWNELFEQSWFSHLVGIRKPDPKIFRLLLNEKELKAEETLFIDDSKANTDAAEKLGFAVLYLEPGMDILDLG